MTARKFLPTDVHVIKSGGDTFDKGCTEGSETYRFEPSMLNGKGVPVLLNV
jgi:hypothetical protein